MHIILERFYKVFFSLKPMGLPAVGLKQDLTCVSENGWLTIRSFTTRVGLYVVYIWNKN